jgi:5'-nucleotidase
MKRSIFLIMMLSTVIGYGLAQTDTITILFAGDTHSNLAPIGARSADLKGTVGGIARAATLIGMTKMSEPNVLAIHAGDAFIGDIFYNSTFGMAELQIMTKIGYDVMTLGNHEFDLGPELLQMALDSSVTGSAMSIVSSNIDLPDTNTLHLQNHISQFTIRQTGSVKTGFFGLTTPETNLLSRPQPVQFDEDIPARAMAAIDSLKNAGCAVIVCVSHLGIGTDTVIASAVPGIDLIISAHDHLSVPVRAVVNPSGKTTWISQANAFYTEMGKVRLRVSAASTELLSSACIPLDAAIPEAQEVSTEVDKLIALAESQFGPLFTKQISFAAGEFNEVAENITGTGPKATPIGILVTEAFREFTGTDIAIEPGGSTAQGLPKGPIVGDDLFRVVGYGFNEKDFLGFRLATFSITGESLYIALEKCLATIDANDEFFPQVSGMNFSFAPHRNPGSRIDWVTVNNEPLDPIKRYTVTTNELAVKLLQDLLGIGLSDISILSDVSEYRALAAYVAQRDTIIPVIDNRITEASDGHQRSQMPNRFFLKQNFPNPFNPSTTIAFELPGDTHATLRVYDVLGKEVATLVDEQLPAGSYSAAFDGRQCASGVYIYALNNGSVTQSKKMLLIK